MRCSGSPLWITRRAALSLSCNNMFINISAAVTDFPYLTAVLRLLHDATCCFLSDLLAIYLHVYLHSIHGRARPCKHASQSARRSAKANSELLVLNVCWKADLCPWLWPHICCLSRGNPVAPLERPVGVMKAMGS